MIKSLSKKSVSLPGVATMISGPAAHSWSCPRALAPPYTQAHITGDWKVSFWASSSIWVASSRVGARIRALGRQGVLLGGMRLAWKPRRWMAVRRGTRKATVLPEPVWAAAITSRPERARGTVCFWMGVGAE